MVNYLPSVRQAAESKWGQRGNAEMCWQWRLYPRGQRNRGLFRKREALHPGDELLAPASLLTTSPQSSRRKQPLIIRHGSHRMER